MIATGGVCQAVPALCDKPMLENTIAGVSTARCLTCHNRNSTETDKMSVSASQSLSLWRLSQTEIQTSVRVSSEWESPQDIHGTEEVAVPTFGLVIALK